jgi:hypothetical protein
MPRIVATYRLVFAVLAAIALGCTAAHTADPTELVDFFSYFTEDSNILGVLVLAWGGVAAAGGRRGVPDQLRGAVVVYLVATGVVYATLLSSTAPMSWTNTAMHRIMPLVVALDWLITPPRRPLSVGRSLWWLLFPAAYLAYTLLRGPHAGWYPYPFLTPTEHGYPAVAVNCAVIAAGFASLILAVAWSGNALARRRAAGPAPESLPQP